MVDNNFYLAICAHLGGVVEGFFWKSQRLGEGVTMKAGGGGVTEGEKGNWMVG